MTSYIIVMITVANKREGKRIAQCLLREKLIACANIVGPVSSLFRWSGKIVDSREQLVLMKSRVDLFDKIVERVKMLHSYEVPEIISLPVAEGSTAYVEWLDSCLQPR